MPYTKFIQSKIDFVEQQIMALHDKDASEKNAEDFKNLHEVKKLLIELKRIQENKNTNFTVVMSPERFKFFEKQYPDEKDTAG